MRRSMLVAAVLAFGWAGNAIAADAKKPDAKADDANPLAKFSEEKLVDIGFCFDEFCKAVAAKDVKLISAFLDGMPKNLAKLDLKKDADKETFLKAFEIFSGAQIEKAQKMHGMGEVTYKDKDGRERTQRMQLAAGVWKITGL
jgi:hypothetical protein